MYTTPNVPREKIPGIIFYMLISVVSLIANDFEYRLFSVLPKYFPPT